MSSTIETRITGDVLIPDLLRRYPKVRAVLDKYGLKGCGGPEGPHESLRVFARAHDVDLQILIDEMKSADQSAAPPVTPVVELADVIYRRFFIAAVVFLLTVGASWGAHILAKIAKAGSFGAVSQLQIQAHGQAQVFGWMCLVIMGFAYQAFPRFWHTCLASARRADLSFWFMVAGIVLASTGITAAGAPWSLPVGVMGAALELCAACLFGWEIVATFKQSKKDIEPYVAYVLMAIGWFVIGSVMNVIHIWALEMADVQPTYAQLVSLIQGPMRDVQFHGLGLTIILGVSLRTLPHIFGVRPAGPKFAWGALLAVSSAVFMEVAGPLLKISFGMLPPALLLFVAIAAPIEFRLWRAFPEGDRSEKFIKAAWLWLVVSQTMLVMAPIYASLLPDVSNHAYQGAIRHAITVGFISLMIMGYGAKVVATLNGYDVNRLSNLLWPFLLVNVGCAMRVIGQTWTDINTGAFAIAGISGVLETTGMAIWGVHIVRLILMRKRAVAPADNPAPAQVTATDYVGEIIDWYPQTIPVFVEFGFSAVVKPVLRRTVGRQVTVEKACNLHSIDVNLFVDVLNHAIAGRGQCVGCTGTGCGGDKEDAEPCH